MRSAESVFVDVALLHKAQRRYRLMRLLLGIALIIIYFQWLAIWELQQKPVMGTKPWKGDACLDHKSED